MPAPGDGRHPGKAEGTNSPHPFSPGLVEERARLVHQNLSGGERKAHAEAPGKSQAELI